MADLKAVERRLREKERELSADVARLDAEARAGDGADVQDAVDDAASAERATQSLLEGSLASRTLTEVRDALRRLEAGTWGPASTADARSNRRDSRQSRGRPGA